MYKLTDTNWRQLYIDYNRARKAPDDARFWDGRAKDFSHYSRISDYAQTFIEYLELAGSGTEAGVDSIQSGIVSFLDMGAGSGTLAIPLARAGHKVLAADFSPGMLAELERSLEHEGLLGVSTIQLDFNATWPQWQEAGLAENCVDIAMASRSTMVSNMWEAFEKLERVARKKVAVTLATEFGPRGRLKPGEIMIEGDGRTAYIPDYIFAVNILFQMGRTPTLRYINADKRNKEGKMQKVRWAFVSWDVQRQS